MFCLKRPTPAEITDFLAAQRYSRFSYEEVGATRERVPDGYIVDHSRVELGCGEDVFRRAIRSLQTWQMVQLGWAEFFESNTPIQIGSNVVILVHHFGFWSLNGCRIVYVLNEDRKYGFAYGTLQNHAEQGEERFFVDWSADDDVVSYDILAFSRPHQWQAKLAHPIGRRIQRRFARDSMAAMARSIGKR